MISRWIRTAGLLAMAPVAALAFETVDTLPFPSSGAFPGWPGDRGAEPWSIFAYGGLMYDSNAFRRDTREIEDIVARYGAGGRAVTRVFGRQSVLLEGYGEYYDYNHLSEIDHFGYGLRGDLLWEIGNQINGTAAYSRRRRHADLGEFGREERVMVTSEQALVDGGYRFAPNWRVFGGAEHSREKRDVGETDLERSTLRGRLTYGTPLGNAIGAEVRGTRGDERVTDDVTGISETNEYYERELAATLAYVLGAQLRVGGRLGRTERTYDDLQGRDFSGTTYRGRVTWLPTPKLILSLEGFREPESSIDIDAIYVLRSGAAFGASWAATYKLVFTARLLNEHRQYKGDPVADALGTERDDTLRTWRFGAGWEPQRNWQIGAGIDFGERRSSELRRNYDYTQVMLNVRWIY